MSYALHVLKKGLYWFPRYLTASSKRTNLIKEFISSHISKYDRTICLPSKRNKLANAHTFICTAAHEVDHDADYGNSLSHVIH